MTAPAAHILIVEDEAIVAMDIERSLIALGYAVTGIAMSGELAIEMAQERRPDLVLMDIRLKGDIDGIAAALAMKERFQVPVIFLTAFADADTVRRAKASEPYGFVLKPFEESDLETAIQIALHKHKTDQARLQLSQNILADTEERFQLLVESVHDYAIYLLDAEGNVASWNLGATRNMGYNESEIIGRHFSVLYSTNEMDECNPREILSIARKQNRCEKECWQVRKDGGRYWSHISVSPLLSKESDLRGFACVTRDITERKRAEEALIEAERRFHVMADTAPAMIWMSGFKAQYIYFNASWLEFTGRPLGQLLGTKWTEIIHPEHKEQQLQAYSEAFDHRKPFKNEYRLQRADGQYRWMLDQGVPLYTPSGEFSGYVGSCIDIHERKLTEMTEILARKEAEKINRMKDEFLATLSHELRTPLTPIIGWTNILLKGNCNSIDVKRGLTAIERNAETQRRLVEDLLDVSRIIAGKLALNSTTLGLAQIIEAGIDAVQTTAEMKSVAIQFKMLNSVGPISGDAVRLQQVVWNLLNNAIKFSRANGTVEVRLSRRGASAIIEVIDQGEGFDPEYGRNVFDMFSQEDSSSTRKFGGLGIGLAIVRHLTEMHGGSVKAESKGKGRGATFTVALPLPTEMISPSERFPAITRDPESYKIVLSGRTVLIVDDDEDTRVLITFVLRQFGAIVLAASSVDEALAILDNHSPDVVVSDLGMPDQDGVELLRRMRARDIAIPVIALTAYARVEDRKRVLAEGFAQHISKPMNPVELAAVLAKLCIKEKFTENQNSKNTAKQI